IAVKSFKNPPIFPESGAVFATLSVPDDYSHPLKQAKFFLQIFYRSRPDFPLVYFQWLLLMRRHPLYRVPDIIWILFCLLALVSGAAESTLLEFPSAVDPMFLMFRFQDNLE